jgi:integrase
MSNKITINDRVLAALGAPAERKDMLLFDRTLPGFGVRVSKTGKYLLYSYNVAGKTRREPIGRWGEALTAASARKQALQLAARVRLGGDPAAERRARHIQLQKQQVEDGFVFVRLIEDWESAMALAHRRYAPAAAKYVRRHFAAWLNRPATSIARREVIQQVDRVARDSGIIAARRVLAYARTIFAWAVKRDAVSANPFLNIAAPGAEHPRERVLSDAELGAIWRAAGALDPIRAAFVRLLMLTLQRRGEVAGLSRAELAPDLSTWTLPGERTKNGKTHLVHLAPLARDILAEVPRLAGSNLVFASVRGRIGNFDRIKQQLDAAILAEQGQPLPLWVLHDLRRSGVSHLAGSGIAPHVADRLLNHVGESLDAVARVYQRAEFLPERKAALEVWARHLQAAASGQEIAGNVVALR